MLWRASERLIRDCVKNAMALACAKSFESIAFPIIGAGSGGFNGQKAQQIMEDEFGKLNCHIAVTLVVYAGKKAAKA